MWIRPLAVATASNPSGIEDCCSFSQEVPVDEVFLNARKTLSNNGHHMSEQIWGVSGMQSRKAISAGSLKIVHFLIIKL